MSQGTQPQMGAVVSLWRYPVKSMMGEELQTVQVRDHGLLGDRAYALLDRADGKVATAKNPRKWPNLFAFRATYIEPSGSSAPMPSVRMTLPDGTIVTSAQHDCHQVLSQALNREVTLAVAERGQEAGVRRPCPRPGRRLPKSTGRIWKVSTTGTRLPSSRSHQGRFLTAPPCIS